MENHHKTNWQNFKKNLKLDEKWVNFQIKDIGRKRFVLIISKSEISPFMKSEWKNI